MGDFEKAEGLLAQADVASAYDYTESTSKATRATAHYLAALIDIITGDRENEIQDANDRIVELEEQLEGCRNALRQRENAEANAAKTNNDLRKSYE